MNVVIVFVTVEIMDNMKQGTKDEIKPTVKISTTTTVTASTTTTVTTTTTHPDGVNIACWVCAGQDYLCSDETDLGTLEYCWPNITTCSIGKLTDRTTSQVQVLSLGIPQKWV